MAISKITLNGVTQIDLTSDTVTASKLFDDYTAHGADGTVVTGSYVAPTARTSSDVTVSGATVTIPAGAYSAQVQKSVATGTAGTPSATKGAVSNHSISVTPSVTNSEGWISSGTKTGTAVTVSASELVSGDKSITQNGTNIDVADYATVTVNVSGGGGSNVVTGTFTTGSTRGDNSGRFTINYSGTGYPIMLVVCADNGTATGNPAWLANVSNYDIGCFSIIKRTSSAPSYTTASDVNNVAYASYFYRYDLSTITPQGNTSTASYIGSSYSPSYAQNAVKFIGSGATVGYRIGNSSGTSIGLSPSTTYNYIAVYSE